MGQLIKGHYGNDKIEGSKVNLEREGTGVPLHGRHGDRAIGNEHPQMDGV